MLAKNQEVQYGQIRRLFFRINEQENELKALKSQLQTSEFACYLVLFLKNKKCVHGRVSYAYRFS